MAILSPILTGTPGEPPSYNVGMAETFSWVPIENDANRPLFARAGYITNLSDLPNSPVKNKEAWLTYRQALRDLPQNFSAPEEVVWPEPPDK